MSPSAAVYLALAGAIVGVAAFAGILRWIAGRKRLAAEIVGRAEQHAADVRQQAGREAESLKKEALLEARERAHALVADADAKARARQQEIAGLDQGLADKTRALADRLTATETLERDLRARHASAADAQTPADPAAAHREQIPPRRPPRRRPARGPPPRERPELA